MSKAFQRVLILMAILVPGILSLEVTPAFPQIAGHCVSGGNGIDPCFNGTTTTWTSQPVYTGGSSLGTWLGTQLRCLIFGGCDAPPSSHPLPLAMPEHTYDPAFNCSRASLAAELRICHSKELSFLDRALNIEYVKLLQLAARQAALSIIVGEQRSWLNQRDACGSNEPCLARSYRQRIAVMRSQVTAIEQSSNPHFACVGNLGAAERTVCDNQELGELDRRLNRAYGQFLLSLDSAGRQSMVSQQREWIRTRDACGNDQNCIKNAYTARIATLDNRPFACRGNLNSAEQTICHNATLAELDGKLNAGYRGILAPLDVAARQEVATRQTRWLRDTRDGCGSNTSCLHNTYLQRISALQDAANVLANKDSGCPFDNIACQGGAIPSVNVPEIGPIRAVFQNVTVPSDVRAKLTNQQRADVDEWISERQEAELTVSNAEKELATEKDPVKVQHLTDTIARGINQVNLVNKKTQELIDEVVRL